jgi:nucleoside-diphosphate-sugar epimerase
VSAHVGEGSNIWAMVHVDDLAELFVLALERAPAGHLFHTATSEVTACEVAESIARAHDLPVAPWTLEQAAEQWGAAAATILAASERTDSAKARALLGWAPRGPSVTDEIERGSYTPVREAA